MKKHFLEQYRTQDKPEAERAAKRKEKRTGEGGIHEDRSERILAYIERLEEVFMNPDAKTRERRTNIFKEKFLYPEVIVKNNHFPDSYFEYQKQEAKRRGLGDIEFGPEDKQREVVTVQEKQKKSLNAWIDHLTSSNSHYPADIKYFVAQGILKTGSLDKKNYRFGKRIESSTASFPEIDHEALSMVMGALEAVHHQGDQSPYHPALLDLIAHNKDFGSMYAEAMRYLDAEAGKDKALEITDGEWRIFPQGSDPQELVRTFAGKRAYLCLGNIGDASGYLKQGDVHVYFSNNRAGEPIWPRVAIAVKPEAGAYELRGTYNTNEDVDPEIEKTDIIKDRLATIPNGKLFAKQDADMKKVTKLYEKSFSIDKKTKEKTYLNPALTQEELQFLYEINAPIEGFGYQKDPRIAELRSGRNTQEDMLVILNCTREQIAQSAREINETTKVYLGKLKPGIFETLQQFNIEQVYTSFPEGKIKKEITIGGKTRDQLVTEMNSKSIQISDYAQDMLNSKDFKTLAQAETGDYVRLRVRDLLPGNPTTDQLYARANELGLDLCPAEVGPHYRLKYLDQPLNEYNYIAMKQIAVRDGFPLVFGVYRRDDGLWLDYEWARPDSAWHPSNEIVFRLRKQVKPLKS